METNDRNSNNQNVKMFIYDWVIKEWHKLDKPKVWDYLVVRYSDEHEVKPYYRLWMTKNRILNYVIKPKNE